MIFEYYLDIMEKKSATCCNNLSQGGLQMEIRRDFYLDKLIKRKTNGLIKVITGICRCGKSYLLNNLFIITYWIAESMPITLSVLHLIQQMIFILLEKV